MLIFLSRLTRLFATNLTVLIIGVNDWLVWLFLVLITNVVRTDEIYVEQLFSSDFWTIIVPLTMQFAVLLLALWYVFGWIGLVADNEPVRAVFKRFQTDKEADG